MKFTVNIDVGKDRRPPTKADINESIEALDRARDGNPCAFDDITLVGIKRLLVGIKKQIKDCL